MGKEIERKFLVSGEAWKDNARSRRLRQGYLSVDEHRTIRVRVAGEEAWLNLKGTTSGISRSEFEYPIPLADALVMLRELCLKPIIDKTRHELRHGAHTWEVDEFHGENTGLVVAEIELSSEDEAFERPSWLGVEVSGDPRYFNASLVRHPFRDWGPRGPRESGK